MLIAEAMCETRPKEIEGSANNFLEGGGGLFDLVLSAHGDICPEILKPEKTIKRLTPSMSIRMLSLEKE